MTTGRFRPGMSRPGTEGEGGLEDRERGPEEEEGGCTVFVRIESRRHERRDCKPCVKKGLSMSQLSKRRKSRHDSTVHHF